MQNIFNRKISGHRGISIFEVLLASAIVSVGILALIQTYGVYVKYALNNDKRVQATFLLEGAIEAMTTLRDDSWTTYIVPISTATTSLYFNGTKWTISSTTNEYIDNGTFVRNVKVDSVLRDGTGKIASSGSTDADTRLITVTVAYKTSAGTTTETLSKYLVNMYNN